MALGTLIGDVSRANRVWRELGTHTSSLMMFRGPEAYVTPGWDPGKAEHGKVVPTWIYAAAHAHGIARAVEKRGWLLNMLNRLTDATIAPSSLSMYEAEASATRQGASRPMIGKVWPA